ncbi:MAG: sialate O-acetylesterase [Bacteroides sp.]|nr:sialate O-acetylesterase [Bacteroides sp.]
MKKRFLETSLLMMLMTLLQCTSVLAQQLTVPQILSSNMVLQQGREVPIWGTAQPNERITVSFAGQRLRTRADKEGRWQVTLKPLTATYEPRTLTVKGTHTSLSFDNVVVGEVWLCSGQSNMAYKVARGKYAAPAKGKDLGAEELQKPVNEKIRVFTTRRDNKPVAWKVADSISLSETSAVGYFFGKQLQQKLDVPVGIITSAVNGTRIEAWTAQQAYAQSPMFAAEQEAGKGVLEGQTVGNLYDKLIEPLAPFALRGFLWYQGESNITSGIGERRYAEKLQVMTENWRSIFGNADAPFYYVLLAPHLYSGRTPKQGKPATAEELPIFRQQQIKAQSMIPHSDFISIWDLVDNAGDIHPSYKWKVGERLARLALVADYGVQNMEATGPHAIKAETADSTVIVTFNHVGEGLKSRDRRRLNWFEVAGADGIFRPALADVCGTDSVKVYHPEVKHPVKVRFGWHETAMPNLVNSDNLPAMPFVMNADNKLISND